jgi:hypothetical protein
MEETMTQAELLKLIRSERRLLEAELADLDGDRLTKPGVEGRWSIKDLIAHLTVWEGRMVKWLKQALRGEVPEQLPSGLSWDDVDDWNQKSYLQHRDRHLDEILAESDRSYREAVRTVEMMPEEALIRPDYYVWRGGRPLWEIVAANTYWHYQEHRQAIRTWLGRE